MKPPLSLRAYQAATALIEPVAPMVLRGRARRGKEDPARLGERLGHAGIARALGPLVWLHGISVGESLSLLPLAEALRRERPDVGLLVTSGTQTSAALLTQRLPPGAIHQYVPIDGPRAVARFLDHWRPDLAVFVESELWPNLLTQARRRGVKTALLSAKLSEASAKTWRRAPALAHTLLGGFDLLLAQDERAAERLASFGARTHGVADLKFGADALPVDDAALDRTRAALAGRPMLLAASTHPGEDEIVLARFKGISSTDAASHLVIVPRHPERGAAISGLARDQGFTVALQSAGDTIGGVQVYVADRLGELGLWYRLARLAIVGGSLRDGLAGHNPLEPARLGCPFVSGPHIANWTSAYAELVAADATKIVDTAAAIDVELRDAITAPVEQAARADRARTYVNERDDSARAVPSLILDLLP